MKSRQSRRLLALTAMMCGVFSAFTSGMEKERLETERVLCHLFKDMYGGRDYPLLLPASEETSAHVDSISFQPKDSNFSKTHVDSITLQSNGGYDYVPEIDSSGYEMLPRILTKKDINCLVSNVISNPLFRQGINFQDTISSIFKQYSLPLAYTSVGNKWGPILCIYNNKSYYNPDIRIGVLSNNGTPGKKIDLDITPYEDFISNNPNSICADVSFPTFINTQARGLSPVLWLYHVMKLRGEINPDIGCYKALKKYLDMNKLCLSCYSVKFGDRSNIIYHKPCIDLQNNLSERLYKIEDSFQASKLSKPDDLKMEELSEKDLKKSCFKVSYDTMNRKKFL